MALGSAPADIVSQANHAKKLQWKRVKALECMLEMLERRSKGSYDVTFARRNNSLQNVCFCELQSWMQPCAVLQVIISAFFKFL